MKGSLNLNNYQEYYSILENIKPHRIVIGYLSVIKIIIEYAKNDKYAQELFLLGEQIIDKMDKQEYTNITQLSRSFKEELKRISNGTN